MTNTTRKLASEIGLCLLKLQRENASPAAVITLFASIKAKPETLHDVFWMIDNDHRMNGHSMLRGCRNHHIHGPELFALFQ